MPVVLAVAGGLLLLAVAPDRFVAGSAALADRWGVSRVVIGAVIVGFGTSAPEMLVSGLAAAGDEPDVGIGNVIGSNMANLGLVVGVAGLVGTLGVPPGLLRRELPFMVGATVLFAVVVQSGISRPEGVVLFAVLAVGLVALLREMRVTAGEDRELAEDVEEFLSDEAAQPVWRMAADTVTGLAGTLVGAQLLVWGAVEIADRFDLSGGFVGLTLVAVGTSLPELVTALAAARAGEDQLILGNVVGSNVFNSLAVGGVIGVVGGARVDDTALTVGAVACMLVITVLATAVLLRQGVVTKGEAIALVAAYLAFLPLLS